MAGGYCSRGPLIFQLEQDLVTVPAPRPFAPCRHRLHGRDPAQVKGDGQPVAELGAEGSIAVSLLIATAVMDVHAIIKVLGISR
jgi:hypothetical protein